MAPQDGYLLSPADDRPMTKLGPLAAAVRFGRSVPGQILINTAAFTLPQELRMSPHWRVLDVSCRRASLVRVLANRACLQVTPVGLDPSQQMLAQARRDIANEGGPQVGLTRGMPASLPFADATFHLIVSGHAFKYFDDDELRAHLVETRRVLKPGALFLAWEFAPTRSELLDRWNRAILAHDTPIVRLRGYRELRSLAYACGFDWVQPAGLRPFLLPPIPRVSLIMGKAPDGWRSTVKEGRRSLEYVGDAV